MIEHIAVAILAVQVAYMGFRYFDWKGANENLRFQRDLQQRAIGEMWDFLYDHFPQHGELAAKADYHKLISRLPASHPAANGPMAPV